jgi:hypothetical protein
MPKNFPNIDAHPKENEIGSEIDVMSLKRMNYYHTSVDKEIMCFTAQGEPAVSYR